MLTDSQEKIMKRAGFTTYEIYSWKMSPTTKTSTFRSSKFQSMIKSRAKYCTDLLKAGWTHEEILREINKYFNERRKNIGLRAAFIDFLEIEYGRGFKPKMQIHHLTKALKIRKTLNKTLGTKYAPQVIMKQLKKAQTVAVKELQDDK